MSESEVHNFYDLYTKHSYRNDRTPLLDLWHYTSANGLTGIVRADPREYRKLHFWFTRSDCLNDTSEGVHILTLFRQVCDELLNKEMISRSFYNIIKDVEIPDHHFIYFPIPSREDGVGSGVFDCVQCSAYICSFSLKEDSLDMWRYYSKGDGGYGLKCYSYLFDQYKDYEESEYDENAQYCMIRSYKVVYDEREKKNFLTTIIIDTFSAYEKAEENEKQKNAIQFIEHILQIFQFQFKHECFSSEQEYRFVIYLPNEKPEYLKNEMPVVRFRTQDGMPVPYIDLTIDHGNAWLEEVLISPYIKSESVLAATKDYLSQCGYSCQVRVSQLPVKK